jgi:uncharacterized protein (DUF934 family)
MPLIKGGEEAADPWLFVGDGAPLPATGAVVVPLVRWLAERDALVVRTDPVGVRLASHERAEAIAGDVGRLGLIAIEFPAFRDGRAYSTARLLRERYGYGGELRAVGNVLRDQLLFMHRCGFDAFEIADPEALASYRAALAEISVVYQATGDGRVPASRLRRGGEASA